MYTSVDRDTTAPSNDFSPSSSSSLRRAVVVACGRQVRVLYITAFHSTCNSRPHAVRGSGDEQETRKRGNEAILKNNAGCRALLSSQHSLIDSDVKLSLYSLIMSNVMADISKNADGFCCQNIQESPAVADKPARRLRKVCTVYVRAVGL